ncbi:Heavy metal-associated domain, HMA [Moelleriella libera RCEF 2490]|uniref:Heavy metal-associated domain, HMA n=1 Tax=Moelleriella libera RCEF 2490 TaxID=1081109 RepID=A0A166UKV4_9HYPO|nr:Heavy metal-associated domain, HMA [Moelleriella libera RCEF 2490]
MSAAVHTYKFEVAMSCGGCSNAINKALARMQEDQSYGINSYEVSLDKQSATVVSTGDVSAIKEKLVKTGKKVGEVYRDGEDTPIPQEELK